MTDFCTQSIADIMEECQHWLSNVISDLFFPDASKADDFSLPLLYTEWISSPEAARTFQVELLNQVRFSADTMKQALLKMAKSNPPQKEDFAVFMQVYEDFMIRLNQVENDSILSGHGIDKLTGFKANSILVVDLKKELDRRARRGNPFSVALLRIDGSINVEVRDQKLKIIAEALRRCIRSFDDVYRINDNDLLVGLKHSDAKGALRFVERLKDEMKAMNTDFTFSSCCAEPDPEDDLATLLANLEKDLGLAAAYGAGQSIKYEEVSPLQRFVSTLKEK